MLQIALYTLKEFAKIARSDVRNVRIWCDKDWLTTVIVDERKYVLWDNKAIKRLSDIKDRRTGKKPRLEKIAEKIPQIPKSRLAAAL